MTEPSAPPATEADLGAFPQGFLWGAATAAYQIEGAASAGGRGRSIWDTFSHTPGRTHQGDTGDVAADHYHRWRADLDLMAALGLGAYRFSIAWPRVQPDGRGALNAAGLDFYDRLTDGLCARGIAPVVTLYHWDLPQALEDTGGWRSRDTAGRFADYAAAVAERLGDRVLAWSTINEPWCAAFLGHVAGVHAPGMADADAGMRAAHHLLLAHGRAVAALRAAGVRRVGITLNLFPVTPASGDPRDVAAARLIDGWQNRLFLDAVLRGRYPDDVLARARRFSDLAFVADGDLDVIGCGVDELGVNYYTRHVVRGGRRAGSGQGPWPDADDVTFVPPSGALTAMGWPVDPDGLTEILVRVHTDYPGTPLVIHENGAAYDDSVGADGHVDDHDRTAYLAAHVAAAGRALHKGVELGGYFVWSLLDNFEWAKGYAKRFGIVHVDRGTQQRTPKASALWYRDLIAAARDAR